MAKTSTSTSTSTGKAIRMRHVFSNAEEVCHQWANQRDQGDGSRDYGRNGHDNCSFKGDELISYRTVIAKRFDQFGIVLFTTEHHSQTTDRQLRSAKSAMRGHSSVAIEVPNVDLDCSMNYSDRRKHLENLSYIWRLMIEKLTNFIGNPYGTGNANYLLAELREFFRYVDAFKLGKLLSPLERTIRRVMQETDSDSKQSKNTVQIPDSSLEHENAWVNSMREQQKKEACYRIAVELGVIEDDASIAPLDKLAKEFHAKLRTYYDTENNAAIQAETDRSAEEERKRAFHGASHRRFRVMDDKLFINAWKANEPGITAYTHHFGNRITSAIPEVYDVHSYFGQSALPIGYPHYGSGMFQSVRLVDGQVQTSGGVTIPLAEFKYFWRLCAPKLHAARNNPAKLHAVVVEVQQFMESRKVNRSFTMNSMDYRTGSMKFGCHLFAWDDLNSFATELGCVSLPWVMRALPAPVAQSWTEIETSVN